ncbi:MAG: hypothetical protein APF83_04790 [Lutibacter sp. BRH_c52]|nr:MAG: hypothetical protein APF83_04790 [Lutibacter sp. BRH_c52]
MPNSKLDKTNNISKIPKEDLENENSSPGFWSSLWQQIKDSSNSIKDTLTGDNYKKLEILRLEQGKMLDGMRILALEQEKIRTNNFQLKNLIKNSKSGILISEKSNFDTSNLDEIDKINEKITYLLDNSMNKNSYMSIFKQYKDEFDKSFNGIKNLVELTKKENSLIQLENTNIKTQLNQFKITTGDSFDNLKKENTNLILKNIVLSEDIKSITDKVKDFDINLKTLEKTTQEIHQSITLIDNDFRIINTKLLTIVKNQDNQDKEVENLKISISKSNENLESKLKELRFFFILLSAFILSLTIIYIIINLILSKS